MTLSTATASCRGGSGADIDEVPGRVLREARRAFAQRQSDVVVARLAQDLVVYGDDGGPRLRRLHFVAPGGSAGVDVEVLLAPAGRELLVVLSPGVHHEIAVVAPDRALLATTDAEGTARFLSVAPGPCCVVCGAPVRACTRSGWSCDRASPRGITAATTTSCRA